MNERLIHVQEQIREKARRRSELLEKGSRREIEALDRELAALRDERQRLSNDGMQRQSGEWRTSGVSPRQRGGRRETPPRRRILMVLLTFGGIALLVSAALVWAAQRFLVPPSLDETLASGESEFTWEEGMGIEERITVVMLALNQEEIFTPVSDDPSPVRFEIEAGATGTSIAQDLFEDGLISDPSLFVQLMEYRGVDQTIEAGLFDLRRNMTMDEVLDELQQAQRADEVTFTVLEGWRAEEIAAMLEASGLVEVEEYLTLVRNPGLFPEYDFLADLPPGASLEGFLFPDTYTVLRSETSADAIIRMQLDTFDRRVTQALKDTATARSMTLFEAVTIASIVEREAVLAEERPTIAGVYINRWQDGTVLNADPTIQYAVGFQAEGESWWKRPLNLEDLGVDSPYNTYTTAGLPPGPISNPGLDALQSTIEAPPTDYYYFVARNDGSHAFAVTLEEHNQNVIQFQSSE